ncbi:hypothetical protein CN613_25565 [Bacillus pseudomycoides]|uniref:Uncharacterized protein n=1 Tax=Bacillus pseudomycoides TaxID=64104 RepID=A0A2A8BZC3_9BACI|nr:hypothetical protein [Bacillus pseudomycoides]PEM65315.1 hypothetical protein CN613_25565 [Bacillus pseudomycoides]
MGQTFNRGELLDKAFKGEIKAGDKFQRVTSGCKITFNGDEFRWVNSDEIVRMGIACGKEEKFEKVEQKVTIELTQSDINSLTVMMNATSRSDLEVMFEDQSKVNEINGIQSHINLRSKLNGLVK